MTSIDAVTVQPRVFERNGLVYANTRDLAVHYRLDHRKLAQSIKQAIETDPDVLEKEICETDAVEVVYRDSHGRTEVSFDLTYGAFLFFSIEMGAWPDNLDPYEHAFIRKEEEIEKLKANAEQVSNLEKRSNALLQDNIRLAQENAGLAYRVHQLEIARGEELDDAVSPSLFRS
jgi:hypothetical protein